MVTFLPDGKYILGANEGEPAEDYSVDPKSSLSIIGMPKGVACATQSDVKTAEFKALSLENLSPGIRALGPRTKTLIVAENQEPNTSSSREWTPVTVRAASPSALGLFAVSTCRTR
jgi:hypothetical protein